MSLTVSLLYKKDSDPIQGIEVWHCCEALHTTEYNYNGLVPMKYFLNHRDITERYIKWLEFLRDDLEIELEWELISKYPVSGWLTYQHYVDTYKELKSIRDIGIFKDAPYSGVRERSCHTSFSKATNDSLRMAVYHSQLLNYTFNPKTRRSEPLSGKYFTKYEVPMMNVKMPVISDKTVNSLKYLNWYLVRFFAVYPHLAQFIIDNREELETIQKKHNLTWYNILFGLGSILSLNDIFYVNTPEPISLECIKRALQDWLEEYYDNVQHDYYDDEEEEDEDYNEREVGSPVDSMYFSDALPSYFKYKDTNTKLDFLYNWVRDTTTGRLIKKDNVLIMETLHKYFKELCTQ